MHNAGDHKVKSNAPGGMCVWYLHNSPVSFRNGSIIYDHRFCEEGCLLCDLCVDHRITYVVKAL